eukprot:3545983-Rhodomonas_salina.2
MGLWVGLAGVLHVWRRCDRTCGTNPFATSLLTLRYLASNSCIPSIPAPFRHQLALLLPATNSCANHRRFARC